MNPRGGTLILQRKEHKCTFCPYTTWHKGNMKCHLLRHTGEKPFGCDVCPKRFASKSDLNRHALIHMRDRL
ncbi:unnamed protein product [Larinioides sclopetarius]|uniref:C2H2-type domain-containing protein n=1 Tax=Larinioides sclopetarius TaxID=280406 RepID=A0AAV2BUP6_9ARAC